MPETEFCAHYAMSLASMCSFYPYWFKTYQATTTVLNALHILTPRVFSVDTWGEWPPLLPLSKRLNQGLNENSLVPASMSLACVVTLSSSKFSYNMGFVNLCCGKAACQNPSVSRADSWDPKVLFKCQLPIYTPIPVKLHEGYKCLGLQRALLIIRRISFLVSTQ